MSAPDRYGCGQRSQQQGGDTVTQRAEFAGAYADPAYVASLAEWGELWPLANAGGANTINLRNFEP